MEFNLGEVIALMTVVGTLIAGFFGLRSMIKSDHRNEQNALKEIKYDTSELREWMELHGASQLKELHDMHNVKDAEGVPVWYVRKSLEKMIQENSTVIRQLVVSIDKQTISIRELSESINTSR